MLVDHDRRGSGAQGAEGRAFHRSDARPPRGQGLRRFLGGSPAAVFLRLLFLSVLAGAFMSMLGVTPGRLFRQAYDAARALAELGLASLHDFGGWIAAGAVVVVPLWLISRLFAVAR